MPFTLKLASLVAVAATMTFATVSTTGSQLSAQELVPTLIPAVSVTAAPASAVETPATNQNAQDQDEDTASVQPATLDALVGSQPQNAELSDQMKCLAGAIYFESKGETLAGQLAVGRVIVNRAKSGRFPASYCGVVYQPSQFSFIRGHAIPAVRADSRGWHEAVAIAQIADANSWKSSAEGALYFHAARVAPHWRMTKLAQVDDHVFYR